MFGSDLLEIAIGMVFIYLLLSIAVTAAHELLAAVLALRGKMLWIGLCNLLPTGAGNPKNQRDKSSQAAELHDASHRDFANALYDHPLIDGLSHADKPSYIPSRTFTIALLDVISKHGGQDGDLSFSNIRTALENLPPSLRKPLLLHWQEAEGQMDRFKSNIEVWFNNSMDRVSGCYKRQTQWSMLILAMVFTIGLNVDSIELAKRLSTDKAFRTALITEAGKIDSGSGSAAVSGAEPKQAAGKPAPPNVQQQMEKFDEAIESINKHGFPIGWSEPWKWTRIIGWLLTGLAASLGAPFWFDVLNKFMNIRSSGKAPEEEPKKPKEIPQPAGPGEQPGVGMAPGITAANGAGTEPTRVPPITASAC